MFLAGASLMGLNFYGLSQELRRPGLGIDDHSQLRFLPERVWAYEESIGRLDQLSQLDSKDEIVYAANQIIHDSLVHVDWLRVDPNEYRQLIPPWENYFLFVIGRFSGLPQFERYHFSDYRRSIERGIGICGDFSMVLSQVLALHDIPSKIVSFDGHVVVEYVTQAGVPIILDPDFGVVVKLSHLELEDRMKKVKRTYLDAGYTKSEVDYLFEIYTKNYTLFNDTYDFMSKRYIFERVSYALKWVLPIGMIVFSVIGLWILRKRKVALSTKERS